MKYAISINGKLHGTGTFAECMEELMALLSPQSTAYEAMAAGYTIHRA